MGLSFASAPQDGKAVAIKGLRDLSGTSKAGGMAAAMGGAPLDVMDGYPVYDIGLKDLAGGKGLGPARLAAWRFQFVQGQNVLPAAEVLAPPPGGGSSKFASLSTGHTEKMIEVLRQAESVPDVVNGKYEFRCLRVPALYVTAVWMKDLQDADDLFLLVPPTFPPFREQHVYHAGDLLQLLQAAASQKVAQERKLTPP